MSKAPASAPGSFSAYPTSLGSIEPGLLSPKTESRRLRAPLSAQLSEAERQRLVSLHAAQSRRLELATLWPKFCTGALHVCHVFQHGGREYMLLEESSYFASSPRALEARQASILRRLLSGSSQKAIGIDLGVCSSTVSMSLGTALRRIGLCCSVSRLPLLLNLVVLSEKSGYIARGCTSDESGQLLISVRSPNDHLLDTLSDSERQVAELLIHGLTAREIALQRATSPRTVANQLAAVFAKFKRSGRVELMAHLATATLETQPLECAPAAPGPWVH